MHNVLWGLILIFSHLYMQLLKSLYFPYSVALALCQNQLNIYICGSVSGPSLFWSSDVYIYLFVITEQSWCCSIRVNLEIRYGNASSFLLFKIVPAILGSLPFYINSRISFPISIKSMLWSIDWYIGFIDHFGENFCFTNIEFSDLWTYYIFPFL